MAVIDQLTRALRIQPFRSIGKRVMKGRATVFVIHRHRNEDFGIRGHSEAELKDAIHALRRSGARFFRIRDLIEYGMRNGEFPDDAVAFTIDDGYRDQGVLARVFVSENAPVTMFLITGLLDGVGWPWNDRVTLAVQSSRLDIARVELPDGEWRQSLATPKDRLIATRSLRDRIRALPHDDIDRILAAVFQDLKVEMPPKPPAQHSPLTWDEARQLESDGVEFGAHSVTHRIFASLSEAAAKAEIDESLQRVRTELRAPLNVFAWPIGRRTDFTERDLKLAHAANLDASLATDDDYAFLDTKNPTTAAYSLNRFGLPSSRSNLLQYASWIERAKQLARGARN